MPDPLSLPELEAEVSRRLGLKLRSYSINSSGVSRAGELLASLGYVSQAEHAAVDPGDWPGRVAGVRFPAAIEVTEEEIRAWVAERWPKAHVDVTYHAVTGSDFDLVVKALAERGLGFEALPVMAGAKGTKFVARILGVGGQPIGAHPYTLKRRDPWREAVCRAVLEAAPAYGPSPLGAASDTLEKDAELREQVAETFCRGARGAKP